MPTSSETTISRNQIDRIREHYGPWARTYGDPADDGLLMALVRARENRIIRSFIRSRPFRSVLDAGCGTGAMSRELKAQGCDVWAVDCTPEMVARVEGHVDRALVGDLHDLDLGRTFDLILCIGALEFSSDPLRVLVRLRAHLVPGGRLIVLVPRTGPGGWVYHIIKRLHGLDARAFNLPSFRRLAAQAGFRWTDHRTPFIHNFVATMEAAPEAPAAVPDCLASLNHGAAARPSVQETCGHSFERRRW
jgi:SAM-dependent methyltransferase